MERERKKAKNKEMCKVKSQVKRYASSILVLVGHIYPKNSIPVLVYHSVDNSQSVISITPREFRAQMEYLKYSGYETISLQSFVGCLKTNVKSSQKSVVITFDDGFKNNYSEAFPILRKYGFTATIFLTTNYIGGVCSWQRDKSIPEIPMLCWDEIQEMNHYGIDFGSHSCSHSYLTRISNEELKAELINSKSIIEAKLTKPTRFFCHPYGNRDRRTQRMAKECGYLGAFGGLDFSLANSSDDLYDLKRVGTAHFSSIQDFKAGLLGTYDWYIRLNRIFVT